MNRDLEVRGSAVKSQLILDDISCDTIATPILY